MRQISYLATFFGQVSYGENNKNLTNIDGSAIVCVLANSEICRRKSVFRVKFSMVPEEGVLEVQDRALGADELGLSEPFQAGPALVSYELRHIQGKVFGKFKAKAGVKLDCSRCLKEFHQVINSSFVAEFEPTPEADDKNSRVAPDPEDPELGVVFFDGDQLPIGEEFRQELELQVPLAPLCTPKCKGLCPVCGGNLNENDCGCSTRQKNSPFDGLEKLFRPSKEN